MLRTITFVTLTLMCLSLPAAGMKTGIYQLPSESLASAAALLRSGGYTGVAALTKDAPESGAKDFINGVAYFKSGEWTEAAQHLNSASKSYPLLADHALYFQAQSLISLKKLDEASAALYLLLKNYPDSPLKRQGAKLYADNLFEQNNYKEAITAYQKFIETYPSGTDSLNSQYRVALCREALGEGAAAVKILRNIWLANPASPLVSNVENALQRLAEAGIRPQPYSGEELLRRGSALLDRKKYAQAVSALKSVPREKQSTDFLERLDIRYGQALYRSRNYRDAEAHFGRITSNISNPARAAEAAYWLARCQDRNGKDDLAVTTFLQVADKWPKAAEADNALFEAALARKTTQNWGETVKLIQRLLNEYPETTLLNQALWEGGWSSYKAGSMQMAADFFRKLSVRESGRDRALYWLSRALAASGDATGAASAYATLMNDFPSSYYSLATPLLPEGAPAVPDVKASVQRISMNILDNLPLPSNHERARALITFGLYSEAKKELSFSRSKAGDLPRILAIARLYLEMEDFNSAYNLAGRELAKLTAREPSYALALQYPLPYRELATMHAGSNKLPLPLVYAVIRSESSFSPVAVSPAGAVGLMQLMPTTAAMIEGAGRKSVPSERLKEPAVNISYGTKHMKDLLTEYNGNLVAVIASYNAGGNTVNRWLRNFGTIPQDEFIEQIPYGETRDYVKKVLATTAVYARLYGLDLNGTSLPLPARPSNIN